MTEKKTYVYEISCVNEYDEIICHTFTFDLFDEFNALYKVRELINTICGYCFHVLVREEENPLNILVNIERDF